MRRNARCLLRPTLAQRFLLTMVGVGVGVDTAVAGLGATGVYSSLKGWSTEYINKPIQASPPMISASTAETARPAAGAMNSHLVPSSGSPFQLELKLMISKPTAFSRNMGTMLQASPTAKSLYTVPKLSRRTMISATLFLLDYPANTNASIRRAPVGCTMRSHGSRRNIL